MDIWVGDCVVAQTTSGPLVLRVDSFFLVSGVFHFQGNVRTGSMPGLLDVIDTSTVHTLPVQQIISCVFQHYVLQYRLDRSARRLIPLTDNEKQRYAVHHLKARYNGNKIRVTSFILFSDDTSGNRSKKWKKYDSWLLIPAALDYKERNQKRSHHFVATSPTIKAKDMLTHLVPDIKALEEGVLMYDAALNEEVVVLAPLLMIIADNPRHSERACHAGVASRFPCRKCVFQKGAFAGTSFAARSKEDVRRLLHSTGDTSGTTNSGAGLLELQAWDLTRDCPVEILHTLPLGIAKYLVQDLWNADSSKGHVRLVSPEKENQLAILIRQYRSNAFSRPFSSSMNYHGSFVDRDFKLLVQILPQLLLQIGIENKDVVQCFRWLGELCSLVYISSVPANFST